MEHLIHDVEFEDEARQEEQRQLDRALYLSLQDSKAREARSRNETRASGRASSSKHSDRDLTSLDEEIEEVEGQIAHLQAQLKTLNREREEKLRQIRNEQNAFGSTHNSGDIDYNASAFDWSGALQAKLESVFGFPSFRLCQEGICNASMDRRDVVAIMPTGGGKSLSYQLPALIANGCTLVISPLLALISDQIMHLHEAGVDAVMLTGATSREESDRTYRRLEAMTSGSHSPEIKLCYVTPEKIANSKKFKAILDKLYRVNKLARFIIDEAHCVSSQGHDFRPDYQKLSALRQMFPKVPILALSATCPAAVLSDLITTLRLPPLTLASAANHKGTVLFSTSLYRKNLHYHVLPKPSGGNESIKEMVKYILENHKHDSGIVYCLTKKDAESVADSLAETSDSQIKTGVYHADVPDARKEALHRQWREGRVKVVCATIAFGLGIDKGDVRFVIHHSMSKSLDGFYQESGRAGRDGKDADCVLYYRPQDATRIMSMTYGEHGGKEKALSMLEFASDVEECRKIQFAKYFNKSSKLSFSSWATAEEDTLERCGHCDNCTRPPELLERLGDRAPLVAWQILKVAEAAGKEVTVAQLGDLARGLGGSATSRESAGAGGGRGRGKGKAKEKATVDVHAVAGGKVELSREQTEAVCMRLLVDGYLSLSFAPTAYNINVYLKLSALARRFTQFTRTDITQGKGPKFDCVFVKKAAKTRKSNAAAATAGTSSGSSKKTEKQKLATDTIAAAKESKNAKGKGKATSASASTSTPRAGASSASGKRKRAKDPSTTDEETEVEEDEELYRAEMGSFIVTTDEEDISSIEDEDWQTSLRGRGNPQGKAPATLDSQPVLKRARKSLGTSRPPVSGSSSRTPPGQEVIEISDSD